MTRPGNKILEFASRSSERGKTERVGENVAPLRPEIKAACLRETRLLPQSDSESFVTREQMAPDSLWSSSPINAHKRKNGTFNNGPRLEYEVTGVLVRGIATVLFVAGVAWSCVWFYHTFLAAEPAIIHSLAGR